MSGAGFTAGGMIGRQVLLGQVAGVYGVKGWIRVRSYTRPPEAILSYRRWRLSLGKDEWNVELAAGRRHGKGLVAQLRGCEDRDQAVALVGADISVSREQLPPAPDGSYYWVDLIGLDIRSRDGTELGRITRMMETGANDVMVVSGERERLIPFVPHEVVLEVDLAAGIVRVDWDPEF